MVITAILLLLLVSYLILFLFINHYVNSGQTNYVKQFQVDEPIAVVIAMRNEEDQILDCLHSLYQSAGLSRARARGERARSSCANTDVKIRNGPDGSAANGAIRLCSSPADAAP